MDICRRVWGRILVSPSSTTSVLDALGIEEESEVRYNERGKSEEAKEKAMWPRDCDGWAY